MRLYKRDGSFINLNSRLGARAVTSAKQKLQLLADDTVSISVTSAEPLNIAIGDYMTILGRRYTVNQLPEPTKQGLRAYTYEITLEGSQYDLIDIHYHLPEDAYGDTYYANLRGHVDILRWNINRLYSNWAVVLDPAAYDEDNYQNITATEKNVLAMLQELCELFDVEFEISTDGTTNTLSIKKQAGTTPLGFALQFGRGRGLYNLKRSNVNNSGIVNRLYVYGSSENLGNNYGYTKLCLPDCGRLTSYLEDAASIKAYGIKEGEENYSDIKPERIGVITALGDNRITFVDNSGDPDDASNPPMFDLNETDDDGNTLWLIEGTTAKVTFQTGNLAGYEFDLHSYDHATKTFVINRFTDENGLIIPNDEQDAFSFAVGDKYIITGINLPDTYIKAAQARLESAARVDFYGMTQPQVSYKLSLTEGFFTSIFGETPIEVLHVGDYIRVVDADLGVNKELRITAITRDLMSAHSYDITLSDTVTKSTTVRVLNDIKNLQEVISYNSGFTDPAKARRRWKATQELLSMIFDPEGNYYSEKIKPLSIETQMLSVGAKSTQFTLRDVTMQPNYGGDANTLYINSNGRLVHYGIGDDGTPRIWLMTGATYSGLNAGQSYYIYACCSKQGTEGVFKLSTETKTVEKESTAYNFLVGVLNSVDTDGTTQARLLSLTYGSSTVNGRFIRTGRIESSGGGSTYFDIDSGVIAGKLRFIQADGTEKDVSDIDTAASELATYVNNTIATQISQAQAAADGKIETWFTEDDPAENWTTQTAKASHIGDLWYDTTSKITYRWDADYTWHRLEDISAINAMQTASTAQDTADGKRRVFVDTPYPPYDVGDLWAQGAAGDILVAKTERKEGESYNADDWAAASKYTADEKLNKFIEDTFTPTIRDITSQLDGVIETWFNSGAPTLTNAPASSWDASEYENHLGDLYYDNEDGKAYRFSKKDDVYLWVEVSDTAAAKAMEMASTAQDTADGKRRVFVKEPYPPYDVGDLWANGVFLKVCKTAKGSGTYYEASDWDLATNYTDDTSLNTFISGLFDETVTALYSQIDGKIECFYTVEDPSKEWTTGEDRAAHVGDQWYNTSTKVLYRYSISNGTYSWVKVDNADAIAAAQAASTAQDTADGKRRVFVDTPYPPYDVGDLWAQGAAGDILVAKTERKEGESYNADDWSKSAKYTDDTAFYTFIQEQYNKDIANLTTQLDGKIECYYTATDPATANGWAGETSIDTHVGDQWYNTATKKLYVFTSTTEDIEEDDDKIIYCISVIDPATRIATHYYWAKVESAEAIAAAAAAAAAQKTADGKRTVFVETPTSPYYIGDLWLRTTTKEGVESKDLYRSIADRPEKGSYNANDWVLATTYDNTQTTIDGGIVTAGTVQLANANTASIVAGITGGETEEADETEDRKVRIWAGASKENRYTAPFRVTQDGSLVASKAKITGAVTATSGTFTGAVNASSGRIGRLNIVNNDLVGLDDDGVERVRIGVGSIPTVNTAFTRKSLPFTMTATNDAEVAVSSDTGCYTGSASVYHREVSNEDVYYKDTASFTATVQFAVTQGMRTLTLNNWYVNFETDEQSSDSYTTIRGDVVMYRGSGSSRVKVSGWSIYDTATTKEFTGLSTGIYEVEIDIMMLGVGTLWVGDVKFAIDGGIWIETDDSTATDGTLTVMANDGMLTIQAADKYLFFSASAGFETRYGNNGLRVNSTGVQALVNGVWKTVTTS